MPKRMSDTRNHPPISGLDVIHDWPEMKSIISTAKTCLQKLAELNMNTNGSPEHVSLLLQYIAQHMTEIDDSPQPSHNDIYPPIQNSSEITAAWLDNDGPWNHLCRRNRCLSTDGTDTTSLTANPGGLSGLVSTSTLQILPGLPGSSSTYHNALPSAPLISASIQQNHLDTSGQNFEPLNSSALARTQLPQNETKLLSPQSPFNTRSIGPSSITYSNDTNQLPWSQASPTTSLATSPFPGTPNTRPIQLAGLHNAGPSPASSTHSSNTVPGQPEDGTERAESRRSRRPTYAEIAASTPPTSLPVTVPSVVPSNDVLSTSYTKHNRFTCKFEGCIKSFDWEWKYKDHLKTHTKEKPFECKECNARFGRERDLVKHHQSQKHKKAVEESSRGNNSRMLNASRGSQSPSIPRSASRYTKSRMLLARAASRGRMTPSGSRSVRERSTEPMDDGRNVNAGLMHVDHAAEFVFHTRGQPSISTASIVPPFHRPRSVKRAHSDIDSTRDDDDFDEEQGQGFDANRYPLDRLQNPAYPHLLIPSQSESGAGDLLSPPLVSHSSFIPAIFSSFHGHQSVTQNHGTDWQDDSRTSACSSPEDDPMQFINFSHTTDTLASPQSDYCQWQSSNMNVEANSRGMYPQTLSTCYSYNTGRDCGQG